MSIAPELDIECLIALEPRVHAHAATMTFITREGLKRLDPIERLFHYSNRGVAFQSAVVVAEEHIWIQKTLPLTLVIGYRELL